MLNDSFLHMKSQIEKEPKQRGGAQRWFCLSLCLNSNQMRKIDAALATGHRLFGENRVQEATEVGASSCFIS